LSRNKIGPGDHSGKGHPTRGGGDPSDILEKIVKKLKKKKKKNAGSQSTGRGYGSDTCLRRVGSGEGTAQKDSGGLQ